jgi:hypothetical protein
VPTVRAWMPGRRHTLWGLRSLRCVNP